MNDLRIGQHVITEHCTGTVAAITDGCAATDILRYRVVCGAQDHWFYLDELIAIDNEPLHHQGSLADATTQATTRIAPQQPALRPQATARRDAVAISRTRRQHGDVTCQPRRRGRLR